VFVFRFSGEAAFLVGLRLGINGSWAIVVQLLGAVVSQSKTMARHSEFLIPDWMLKKIKILTSVHNATGEHHLSLRA
jgi:hypothetical protein